MAAPASTLAGGSVGSIETQYLDLPKSVRLDCGQVLHPVRVAYETYGALSPRRDNVILVCHALSGGQLTVVCYTGTWARCGYGRTDTPAGTWSPHQGWFANSNPGLNDLRPAALARGIANGLPRVAGRTDLHGQRS